ncbi:hypothetical protein BCR35DRAFT_298826 [Leucosporidium creatinivorum]|uniref:Uncharacterized protein n=1 Tax=Leucosporidium creatinivorum TaxID=106004 RepID=A0A1Y2G2J7_9BASI|nr:hypothetical protein BCR35DRAFT_298826 [Leucosporidium creatinivorum]
MSTDLQHLKDAGIKHFHHSESTLKAKRDEIKKHYIDPSLKKVSSHYEDKPFLTALLGLFFALSAVPIFSFLAFVLGATVVVGGTALAFSLAILSAVIGTASLFLLGALTIAAVTAATCCFWGVAAVAVVKLVLHLTSASDLPSGLKAYQRDMHALLLGKGKDNGKSVSFEETVKTEGTKE